MTETLIIDNGNEDWNDANAHRRGKECVHCGAGVHRTEHATWCTSPGAVASRAAS